MNPLELTDAEREERFYDRGPIFTNGQKVLCLDAAGYYDLKRGETYVVDRYEPRCPTPTFTWPAYVTIKIGDREIKCHATRFKALPQSP